MKNDKLVVVKVIVIVVDKLIKHFHYMDKILGHLAFTLQELLSHF